MKRIYLFLALLLFLGTAALAQSAEEQHKCAPGQQQRYFHDYQKELNLAVEKHKEEVKNARVEENPIIIPLIIHIIHKGEALGTGSNIGYEQIRSQIDVLNEDFRRRNDDRDQTLSDFKSVAADAGIQFVLAAFDSAGRPLREPGVTRHNFGVGIWQYDQLNSQVKPATIWDPNRYLNIWVVDSVQQNNIGYIGYAQFPDLSGLAGLSPQGGLALTDGVVIDHTNFGSYNKAKVPQLSRGNINLGRTLTHELGHAFGLLHPFEGSTCSDGDFCPDTPSVTTSTFGCNLQRRSCNGLVMIQNFMDYTYDRCMNLFTKDQVARMRTVLTTSPRRKELSSSLTGITREWLAGKINVYPNPAQNEVRLSASDVQLKSYRLCNLMGQEIMAGQAQEKQFSQLQLPALGAGIYLLQVETNKGWTVKKLVIQQ